jgi:hypothetical protein
VQLDDGTWVSFWPVSGRIEDPAERNTAPATTAPTSLPPLLAPGPADADALSMPAPRCRHPFRARLDRGPGRFDAGCRALAITHELPSVISRTTGERT